MYIDKINVTNFNAGMVSLKNMNSEGLHTFDAIKKLAQEKEIDIFIAQKKPSAKLSHIKTYTVLAKNNTGDKNKLTKSSSYAIMSNRACSEEASVRIFNAVMTAIENLEKKLAGK